MEYGLVQIELNMLITHSRRNVIKQMIYESGVREKSKIDYLRILILPFMPFHALLSGQLRTLIYPCEMEEGHGELGSRKYTQSL